MVEFGPDPDPALFDSKKILLSVGTFNSVFKDKKVIKKSLNS